MECMHESTRKACVCVPHAHRFVFRSTVPNGFMQFHGCSSTTHDVRWYNIRLYSTYVRWNRIMHYPTHEVLMFVTLCLLLWSHSRRPVAFSKDIMLSVNVGDKYRRALIHSFIHSPDQMRSQHEWQVKWSQVRHSILTLLPNFGVTYSLLSQP